MGKLTPELIERIRQSKEGTDLALAPAIAPDEIEPKSFLSAALETPILPGTNIDLPDALRYADRAVRTLGLGVGTAAGLTPLQFVPGVNDWLPDIEKTPSAFREFWEQARQGDWDAGIEAYQDELGAGPGYWGAAELGSSFIPTGGPFIAGGKLISKAPGLASTVARVAPASARPAVKAGAEKFIRGTGETFRMPWKAEDALGRILIAKPIGWTYKSKAGTPLRWAVGKTILATAPIGRRILEAFGRTGATEVAPETVDTAMKALPPARTPAPTEDLLALPAPVQDFRTRIGARPDDQIVTLVTEDNPIGTSFLIPSNQTTRNILDEFARGTDVDVVEGINRTDALDSWLERYRPEVVTGRRAVAEDIQRTTGELADASDLQRIKEEEIQIRRDLAEAKGTAPPKGRAPAGRIKRPGPKAGDKARETYRKRLAQKRNYLARQRDYDRYTNEIETLEGELQRVSGERASLEARLKSYDIARSGQLDLETITPAYADPDIISRELDVESFTPGTAAFEERFTLGSPQRPLARETVDLEGAFRRSPRARRLTEEERLLGEAPPVERVEPMIGPSPRFTAPADEAIFPSSPYEQPQLFKTTISRPRATEAGQAGATARTAAGRAAAGGTPPPTPPTATGAPQPQPRPSPELTDLQNFGEAVSVATSPDTSRRMIQTIPGLREMFKRINPSATANSVEQKGVIGRHVLMFEAKQKSMQLMTRLSRLGTQDRILGKTNPDTGLLTDGALRGRAPNDVRTNAGKPEIARLLTTEQKEWIDTAREIEEIKLSMFRREGIDVNTIDFDEGGSYAGRVVMGKTTKGGEVIETAAFDPRTGRVTIGKAPGQTKTRPFKTQKEALAAGWRYLPEDEALRRNVEAAYRRIADKRFADWMVENSTVLRMLGKDEKVAETKKILEEQGLRVAHINPQQVSPKDWEKAIFVGPEADEVAEMLMKELDPKINSALATGAKINAVGRFMVLNGDASPFLIQLAFLAGWKPIIWAQAMKGFVNTLFDTRYHANLINNNRDLLARHRGLITTLRGTEMTEAAQQGGMLDWKPFGLDVLMPARSLLDPFARAFGAALDTAGINLAKTLERTMEKQGRGFLDDAVRMNEIDSFINSFRGLQNSERLGVSGNWRLAESNSLLAPQYNRAIAALIWSIGRGNLQGEMARQAIGTSFAAFASMIVALEIAQYMKDSDNPNREHFVQGSWNKLNPASGDFLTWQIGDTRLGPGTKIRSLINTTARAAKDRSKLNPFSGELNKNPLFGFARGNMAPLAQDAWDILSGRNYNGDPTGFFSDWGEWDPDFSDAATNVILPDIMPIWTKSVLLDGGTIGQRGIMGAAEFGGLRAYPASIYSYQQSISKEMGLGNFDDLLPLQKDRVQRIATQRHGEQVYKGTKGHLWKQRADVDDEMIDTLTEKAKGSNPMYDQVGLRMAYNDQVQNRRNILFGGWNKERGRNIGGLYDQLFDMDEQFEEPDPRDVTKHDVYRYYQIFDTATKQDGKLDFDILDKEESKFWASLVNVEGFTASERIDNILGSIRVLEDRLPPEYQRMRHAQRYAGSLKLSLRGQAETSYYDLETHPLVIGDIVEMSQQTREDVVNFMALKYYEQEAKVNRNPEGKYAMIREAMRETNKDDGILAKLQTEFIEKAPPEWLWGMFTAGYKYKNYQNTNAFLRESFDKIPSDIDFQALHTELLYAVAGIGE